MKSVIGWDIGGAHLKAARCADGRIVDAVQVASPLRFGLERLAQAFAEAKAAIGPAERHAVTMTGELADTFVDRAEGVTALTGAALAALAPGDVSVYGGRAGWLAPGDASAHVEDIASANWHATAALVGARCGCALMIDMGSTTTDIVPVVGGKVAARGYSDGERLITGELVYTGIVRSFLMASGRRAPFAGAWSGLVHENFANMGDVHRILATLPDDADLMPTADGRDKSIAASRARLARMIGRDVGDADVAAWARLAHWFAETQIRAVCDGAFLVLSHGELPDDTPIVGAGSGERVIREVARRLDRPYRAFETLLDAGADVGVRAAQCAPAAAVAVLAGLLEEPHGHPV